MVILKKREKIQLEMNAVRKCSSECYFFMNGGEGCPYFQARQVKFTETCLYDLVHLKNYAEAFAGGDLEFVKKDASSITAMIMLQIRRMLEQVNIEGVTVDEPMTDAKGAPVWIPDPRWQPSHGGDPRMIVAMRKKDHPLIQRSIQLARSIGVNLNEFKLTPKSADEKRSVSGHMVSGGTISLENVIKDRKEVDDRFMKAIQRGTEMTKEDPVFKRLTEDGEIVG